MALVQARVGRIALGVLLLVLCLAHLVGRAQDFDTSAAEVLADAAARAAEARTGLAIVVVLALVSEAAGLMSRLLSEGVALSALVTLAFGAALGALLWRAMAGGRPTEAATG